MIGTETIESIETILKNHGIAEVKVEKDTIVVVAITRKVTDKHPVEAEANG